MTRYYYGNSYNNSAFANIYDSWVMYGYGGNDNLGGHNLRDWIYGGTGNDTIRGYNGDDSLYGESGIDWIYGGLGNDYINGGWDNDVLYGEDGNDNLQGNSGNDYLNGGWGNDALYGESGSDDLIGGYGNDWMVGGTGVDELWGGSGYDKFVYTQGGGTDWVKDFQNGYDRIVVDVSGYNSYADIAATKSQWGNHTLFTLGNGQFIVVENTSAGTVNGADFQFI
jgi:Ca2+-binding RTX toxin-like protein